MMISPLTILPDSLRAVLELCCEYLTLRQRGVQDDDCGGVNHWDLCELEGLDPYYISWGSSLCTRGS